MHLITTTIAILFTKAVSTLGQCFSDANTTAEWAQVINGDTTSTEFEVDQCCQNTVCGIPCPESVPEPPIVSFFKDLDNHKS